MVTAGIPILQCPRLILARPDCPWVRGHVPGPRISNSWSDEAATLCAHFHVRHNGSVPAQDSLGTDDAPPSAWSTAKVGPRDRFAVYHEVVCHRILQVVARAASPETFSADIDITGYPDFQLVHARVSSHELRLTPRVIAGHDRPSFEVGFILSGRVVVEQRRAQADLAPGEFVFWDTTMPGRFWFDEDTRFVQVRTPLEWAETLIAGRNRREQNLVRPFAHQGASGLVFDFVRGLTRLGRQDPEQARLLSGNVPALLGSVLALASGREPASSATQALSRLQVIKYLESHLADPSLDADAVAKAFNVSRRTLYRLFAESAEVPPEAGDESLHATLRRLRVKRAAQLLRLDLEVPLHVVARACGFGTETTLYRSFLRLHGRTPGEFRAALRLETDLRSLGA
jgi:AraC-like DNA-binding protein